MASCSNYALAGIAKPCDSSRGGIVDIWIGNFGDFAFEYAPTGDTSYTAGEITGVTTAVTTAVTGTPKVYHFNVRRNTASLTKTLNKDSANGTSYVSSELTLSFSKMDAKKRLEMNALAMNELFIVVKDANGSIWLLGSENAVEANGGASQTGTAVADGNFYQITFTDDCSNYPPAFTTSAFSTFTTTYGSEPVA